MEGRERGIRFLERKPREGKKGEGEGEGEGEMIKGGKTSWKKLSVKVKV